MKLYYVHTKGTMGGEHFEFDFYVSEDDLGHVIELGDQSHKLYHVSDNVFFHSIRDFKIYYSKFYKFQMVQVL